jgi:ABC-type Fe3+ transport system permease subunit
MRRVALLVSATTAGSVALAIEPDRDLVGNAILALVASLSWVFVVVYGVRSQWRATSSGRAVMVLVTCIGAICTQGAAAIFTDYSYPGREIIRPLLLLGVAVAVLDLLITLVRIQRVERGRGGDRS